MTFRSVLLFCSWFLLSSGPTVAQFDNIETVEGPGSGEETTLTVTPHPLADGLSVRALGIAGSDTTRWALRLLGVERDPSIHIAYGSDSLEVVRVEQPEAGEVGPTTVYVNRDAFVTMAEMGTVTLVVDSVRTSLPESLRREMQIIFERTGRAGTT